MDRKVLCTIFLICLVLTKESHQELINGKIKLSIVTTAGCTDTVKFIQNQLIPTYIEFEEFMEVEFIPWGRTVRNSDGSLTCQFGEPDCWANRVHRCALDMLRYNQKAQIYYMDCEFRDVDSRPAYLERSYLCGFNSGLNRVSLNMCANSFLGDPLDHKSEIISATPMQIIDFVPAVYFNDSPSDNWREIFSNLRNTVCDILLEDSTTGINEC